MGISTSVSVTEASSKLATRVSWTIKAVMEVHR